ncbi:hypothetical protein D6R50_02675 [Aeromonas veronii]|uniref:Uncharacterized protein n=1 Tax=Aeromonas veronii TaxID=654 RepID=A0A3A9IYC7_AERVE|nr:hypothetical protein D6R50_02675 [Aeromonas veronii]
MAEEAGIEPAKAFSAHIGFEDRGGHQTPSTSVTVAILWQISVTGNAFFVIKKRELAIFLKNQRTLFYIKFSTISPMFLI